jgi:predicted RNA binding protein YcfA (HicA-like mRNA interferase family)
MKIPRDLHGMEPARLLEGLGYRITRQTGSHMRLTTVEGTEHHITIPRHAHLKTGTLDSILKEVAEQQNVAKEEIVRRLLDLS